MATTKPMMIIVLARADIAYRPVGTWRHDLGERPKMEEVPDPKSLIWLNEGTATDLKKAKAYARQEGYSVFTYPTTERDPLGRAKKDVLVKPKRRRR